MTVSSPPPDGPAVSERRASVLWVLALGLVAAVTSAVLAFVAVPTSLWVAGGFYLVGVVVLAVLGLTRRVRLAGMHRSDLLVVLGFAVLWVLLAPAGLLAGTTAFWLIGGGAILALSLVGALVLARRR